MGTYSFTKAAIQELESICDDIAIDNPDAASNLFDDIRKQYTGIGITTGNGLTVRTEGY